MEGVGEKKRRKYVYNTSEQIIIINIGWKYNMV